MPQHIFTIFIGFLSATSIFKHNLNLKALEGSKAFPYVPSLSSAKNDIGIFTASSSLLTDLQGFKSWIHVNYKISFPRAVLWSWHNWTQTKCLQKIFLKNYRVVQVSLVQEVPEKWRQMWYKCGSLSGYCATPVFPHVPEELIPQLIYLAMLKPRDNRGGSPFPKEPQNPAHPHLRTDQSSDVVELQKLLMHGKR